MGYKKLSRVISKFLPEKLRHKMMRKNIRVNHEWPSPSFEIKIAETHEELKEAYRILHDSYVGMGYMDPTSTKMRVILQHVLPHTTTIVAKWNSKVVGTLSLIRDNPFGLPLEKIFYVDDRRANGRRLAEVSSLAIDPAFRGMSNQTLFPLVRFVTQYARHYFGIHEFIIAVNPAMVDFYVGFMCFEKLKAKPREYDFVKGAPAVGLYLNFETVDERWKKALNHDLKNANLFEYWSKLPDHHCNQLPKRSYDSSSDPILTPQLLSEFFLKEAKLAEKLSTKEIQVLMDAYPYPGFMSVLEPLYKTVSRKDVRFETQMRAEWANGTFIGEVLNVSKKGLLIRTHETSLNTEKNHEIVVWLNKTTSARLTVAVLRPRENMLCGLKIITSSDEWSFMISSLDQKHQNDKDHAKKAA